MRRDNIFWGTALILFGILLWLQQRGIIDNLFTYFWPLTLILVGGWLILSVYWQPDLSREETFSVPLGGARSIKYKFSHGAGQIQIHGMAPVGMALVGTTAVGMNHRSKLNGDSSMEWLP